MLGLGLGIPEVAIRGGGIPYIAPDNVKTFDAVASNYNLTRNLKFGTDAPSAGQTQIGDLTALATLFDPFSQNASQYRINLEKQAYQPFNVNTHVMQNDGLLLRAYQPNQTLSSQGITSKNPSANTTSSYTIPFANVTGIVAGQQISLGAEQQAQVRETELWNFTNAGAAGDTWTFTAKSPTAVFADTPVTYTVQSGDTLDTIATAVVALINANATYQANNLTAIREGQPGTFVISFPINTMTFTNAKVGTVAGQKNSRILTTYIVSVDGVGNTITLNHPVSVTTASTVTFLSTLWLVPAASGSSTTRVITAAQAALLTVGQAMRAGFQDSSICYITGISGTTITFNKAVSYNAGVYFNFLPMYVMVTNTTTSVSNTLASAFVSPGIQAGMMVTDVFNNLNNFGTVLVTGTTGAGGAGTVVMDTNLSSGTGATFIFYAPIYSGQVWANWTPIQAGRDGVTVYAIEWDVYLPSIACIASWPALWGFSATADTGGAGGAQDSSEIDILELFTYDNNTTSNNFIGNNNVINTTYTAADWDVTNKCLKGNNTGGARHKVQLVWTPTETRRYFDGRLLKTDTYTWTSGKRMQLAMNMAVGSSKTSFYPSGFFPTDKTQFDLNNMSMKIYGMKVYTK